MAKKVQSHLTADFLRKPAFWLLTALLLLGGGFRFYHLNWDFQHSFHPDERNILGQTSSINPGDGYRVHFFAYGQLSVYLYRATGELVSTPAFLGGFFQNSTPFAAGSYFALLALAAAFCVWFFLFRLKRPGMGALGESVPWALGVAALAGFVALAFFRRGYDDWVEGDYWILLSALMASSAWFFSREKWRLPAFGASAFLFVAVLFFKFTPVFSIWANQLNGWPLKLTVLVLVTAVSFGLSAVLAGVFEWDWVGPPLYAAAGATFLLGVLPTLLPEPIDRALGVMAFLVLLAGLALGWAWLFRWGRTLLSLLALWAVLASFNHAGHQYTGYGECMLIGRWWAAVFSTATIPAVYLFVKRAYQKTGMAFLAAAGFAFAVVSIQVAHYCITESLITLMFVVVAIYAFEITREGSWKNYLMAGAAFGFAMAAKTSSLYYIFILVIAHLVLMSKKGAREWEGEGRRLKGDLGVFYSGLTGLFLLAVPAAFIGTGYKFQGVIQDLWWSNPTEAKVIWAVLFTFLSAAGILLAAWGIKEFKALRAQMPEWVKLSAGGALAFLIFCLLSPWSLLDLQGFMSSQNYEWHVVSIADACYVLQFKDTPRYLYQLWNLMFVELWWPLGITVVAGAGWVLARFLFRLVRPSRRGYLLPVPFFRNLGFSLSLPDLLILCWFIPYFVFIGSWNTKFIRYMVPLIPAFCIFGARILTDLFEWLKSKALLRFLKPALVTAVLGPSLFYSMAYMHVYRFPHPWITASVWIYKHIPPGSMILKEAWDDGLPTGVTPDEDPSLDKPMYPSLYRQKDIRVYEMFGNPTDDTTVKKDYFADILQEGDYISIASKKLWYTLTNCSPEFKPHGYNAYPVASRYYRCLWSGLLGYKMVAEFHNFPGLFGWSHPDDMAEESFSVYDHPHVYLFKKVETVPPAVIVRLLSSDDYVKGITRDQMRTITPQNVDQFIAQRQQYLKEHGLLALLGEAASPTPQATPASVKPPAPAQRKENRRRKAAAAALVPSPTPEIHVDAPATVPGLPSLKTLKVLQSYAEHPVVQTDVMNPPPTREEGLGYQLWAWFSWLAALILFGWLALPLALKLLSPFPSGAYSLSKILGFLLFAWTVWFFTRLRVCFFTFGSCWAWFGVLAALSALAYWRGFPALKALSAKWGRSWMIQEAAFVAAFTAFTLVKIYMPHIHDPVGEGYNGGGEAGMDFGFLASVVRGRTFPPQDMWMAGMPIGYTFYFGHLMMGVLTKFLALAPAVTYNLALITLFALIFSGAFGLAYGLSGKAVSGWVAGFLCAVGGNPDGVRQYLDAIRQCFTSGSFGPLIHHVYDFWGPTRVIPNSINEFPYFSVLYGDMHAHTLAMPFAMLMIGIVASFYLGAGGDKVFEWRKDLLPVAFAGFLMGAMAFLNTWEVPTWLVLIAMALMVRTLARLGGKVLDRGLRIVFICFLGALVLLGWWGFWDVRHDISPEALGGQLDYLLAAVVLSFLAGAGFLFLRKSTQSLSLRLLSAAAVIAGVLLAALFLWFPFFSDFVPQRHQILWVPPALKTSIGHFFDIYGLFVTILAFSFLAAYSREWAFWTVRAKGKAWGSLAGEVGRLFSARTFRSLDRLFDRLADFLYFVSDGVTGFIQRMAAPQGPVRSMMSLGVVLWGVVVGASWVHWTEPADWGHRLLALLLATLCAVLLALAVYFRDRLAWWLAALAGMLVWASLLVLHVLHLIQDSALTMGLGLFTVLWLAAFFHLGLAVKVLRDRNLSFSYLLVSLFFFILATLEIFVMKEYLGGDWLRNNSLFKYGINAWTLASVSAGVFLPRIFTAFQAAFRTAGRESAWARKVLTGVSMLLLFILLGFLLQSFLTSSYDSPLVYVAETVLLGGFFAWNWMEGWVSRGWSIVAAVVVAPLLFLAFLPPSGYATMSAFLQGMGRDFGSWVLFPLLWVLILLAAAFLAWEGRKDMGRRMIFGSWRTLLGAFALAVSVYPLCATTRKCHDFLDYFRRQWVGYAETPTLDGLAYLSRANPYDAAAIRFLNNHIPGQPCLVEFVGEGYNSWGSRFSIFTGIPALMGWDGHVREWLTGRRMDEDINQRFQATEQIFRTPDPQVAKKYLDAYGVRLVMVGTLERYGVPGRKGGYPAEGLAKFKDFLPLIYKNPEVEIYYNPPSGTNKL